MPGRPKTIAEINRRLKSGEAVVMTATEFKNEVRSGRRFTPEDVDVVTTATRAVMSGTSAVLVVPMDGGGRGSRVSHVSINGVPCICPSETIRDNALEVFLYGTDESRDNPGRYGGGSVLRDLVEKKEVEIECIEAGGKPLKTQLTIDRLRFARLYNFRNDFQNYMAFANIKNHPSYRENPSSIFSCRPIHLMRGLTVSGSGELNPIENDPYNLVLRSGLRILLNGAPGVLVSYGTRSAPQKRALFVAGDLFGMDPQYMGGFKTSCGIEVTNGIAVPFPITSQNVIDGLAQCLDETIPLPVGDLGDRIAVDRITYADIWKDAPLEVEFDPSRCICCSYQCQAEIYCPMGAISWKDKTIDENLCFGCGACTSNCLGGAFKGKGAQPQGSIGRVKVLDREIPVIFRQSNRFRSQRLAAYLKDVLTRGEFLLTDSDVELTHREPRGTS
jgi:putative methanogenesis marker 16 metalloprotein